MYFNLGKACNVVKCTTVRTINNATKIGKNPVDMSGFESVMFIAIASTLTVTTTGAGKFHKQHTWLSVRGSSISTGTYINFYGVTARSSSGLAAGVNKRLLILDVPRIGLSKYRYLKPFVHGASSASYISDILAIQYNSRVPGSTAGLNASTHVTGFYTITPLSTARVAGASSA